LASNALRRGASIYNDSTEILLVKCGATASLTSFTAKVGVGQLYEIPFGYTSRIAIRGNSEQFGIQRCLDNIYSLIQKNNKISTDPNKKIKIAKFHIFSWSDPKLNIDYPNIINHISNSGDVFLEDFNSLVHSDILVVGSSTFSISAGFFNKNIVLCNSELCKLLETPYPSIWNKNYERYVNEFTY
jgi:hypothetical protein